MSKSASSSLPQLNLVVGTFPNHCNPNYHNWNIMGGSAFNHDGHTPLHRGHPNQAGIVGTLVVRNTQAVGQLLHFFRTVIIIITTY